MPAVVSQFSARKTVTIGVGATTSNAIDCRGATKICVHLPTIDTGPMTFTASDELAGTYRALWNVSGAISIAVVTGAKAVIVDIGAARFIKVVLAAQDPAVTIPIDLGN